MAFLTQQQLEGMGFANLGKNVLISEKASIYNAKEISIGDHSRIDDFAILSAGPGGIVIGNYVHIACHATLIGKATIVMNDYSGVSSRVAVYSSSDNYDGSWMTNPCLPDHVLNTKHKPVIIGKHVVIGSGSTILPGVTLENCSVGAMSLVNKSCDSFVVLAGIPAHPVKDRVKNFLELEKLLIK